jgi:chitinase
MKSVPSAVPRTAGPAGRKLLPILVAALWTIPARAEFWCTAYFPGWEQSSMPASNIDFATVTHVIHFSLVPNTNGSINSSANGITTGGSTDLVARAHAAGVKALICVGGAGSQSGFQGATSASHLATFINNLTNFMAARGYDGIDLDWEPLAATNAQQYTNLVNGLRSALDQFPQPKLLTAAAGAYPPYGDPPASEYQLFAALQSRFDQINIMTYDLSGAYPGWVTWFNSPIYDGGYHFPGGGGLVPSVDGAVNHFLNSGVAAGKLGIGLAFYGYVWAGGAGTSTGGVTEPRQSWTTVPSFGPDAYKVIMSSYYQPDLYHWDTVAQAAWLGITNADPASDMFISYDDPRTCQVKVSYARNHHLGGIMIWELAQDHNPGQPAPLMQSVKAALATPGLTAIQMNGQGMELSFTSLPLGSYRVQWTSDLTASAWSTLALTNITGTGGVVQVIDPAPTAQSQRFYRVQTPP